MAVDPNEVLRSVGAGGGDFALADRSLAVAAQLVDRHITRNLLDATDPVPIVVRDEAVLRVAAETFSRSKTPFGQQVMPDVNGSLVSVRLGTDPLGGVRQLLAQWVGADLGIA